jgi:hypothetical protein
LHPTERHLPIRSADSGLIVSRTPDLLIGADAHSGATVADFHRVPVSISKNKTAFGPAVDLQFSKELSLLLTNLLNKFKEKIKNIRTFSHQA